MESWVELTTALTARTVITVDVPGVGLSPTPRLPLPIPALAATAVAVLDHVGVDRADVLGYSLGGAVAQQLAVQTRDRVHRLVLAATSCGVGATPGNQDALRGLRPPMAAAEWPRAPVLGAVWHSLAVSAWSSIGFLGAITAPTLVVTGTRDRIVPALNGVLLARRIPDARLALLPFGHDLQRREPARALAAVVEPFLAEVRPGDVGSVGA